MNIKRIVVGVDFSEESELALEQAIEIARSAGAELALVHASALVEPLETSGAPESTVQAMEHFKELYEEGLKRDRERLAELGRRASERGVAVSQRVVDGFADHALPKAATELGADLIAVGTHGRTGFTRVLLGSVAERTVRLATTAAVLVARPLAEGRAGFARVLVPTDFSPQAENALEMALQVAAPRARIDLLHCWQLPPTLVAPALPAAAYEQSVGPLVERIQEDARARGAALLSRHRRDEVETTFDVVESSAVKGIRDRAEQGGYDLIALGSHGRRGVRRLLLGSVAEATVRHAPCSVLVARSEKSA